ncbi:MAG: alpha/beta fold hydrolase [Burkholderiales bacterium]|nr:alpha/beta fold hydrolase [Burkholderiales bacterium]
MKRRALLLSSLAWAACARPNEERAWRFEDIDWQDERRERAVPVRLYTPNLASARSSAPLPLVVFSHGIGGSRRGYSYIGRHLASRGLASLHVQHVGSDRQLWAGNVLSLPGRLKSAADASEALARVHDVRFALDRLLAERPGEVDASRIAMAGHSYGANTSLLLAGAAVPGYDGLAEPRFKAAVFISAPPLHGIEQPEAALAAVRLPSLHITCTEDVIRVPGYFSRAAERIELFEQTGSRAKWLAVFEGGSHSVFTDRQGTGGAVQNPRIKAATQRLLGDFVQAVFDGAPLPERLASWHAEHAPMLKDWRGA